jgi:hypothetical protein
VGPKTTEKEKKKRGKMWVHPIISDKGKKTLFWTIFEDLRRNEAKFWDPETEPRRCSEASANKHTPGNNLKTRINQIHKLFRVFRLKSPWRLSPVWRLTYNCVVLLSCLVSLSSSNKQGKATAVLSTRLYGLKALAACHVLSVTGRPLTVDFVARVTEARTEITPKLSIAGQKFWRYFEVCL